MNTIEAMTLLRLSYAECKDSAAIKRAWKLRMRVSHPDKNLHASEESTRLTQRINTAKDFLLTGISNGGYDVYDELEHSRWMASKREELERKREAAEREREAAEREREAAEREREAVERETRELERRMREMDESAERQARVFASFWRGVREMEAECARENAKKCKGPSLDTPHPMVRTWLETRRRKLAKSAR
jgi:curved DNA-binding protein CbpA